MAQLKELSLNPFGKYKSGQPDECKSPPAYNPQGMYPSSAADNYGKTITQQPQPSLLDIDLSSPPSNLQASLQLPNANLLSYLEPLLYERKVVIKQGVDYPDVFCHFECDSEYSIRTPLGQKLYEAEETNDCFTRNLFRQMRPFHIEIKDMEHHVVLDLRRKFACDSWIFTCWSQKIEVYLHHSHLLGTVEQLRHPFFAKFNVLDDNSGVLLKIRGPFWTCGHVTFTILKPNKKDVVGKITKRYSGMVRECCTKADFFSVTFHPDMDLRTRALLLGACFLINFRYFE